MIISVLFKALLFYFLFVFVRGMFQTYRAYKLLKERQSRAEAGPSHGPGVWEDMARAKPANNRNSDIIEAEFRVLDKNN